MALEPVSVALKLGFLVVLYLFALWVARSALRDLRGAPGAAAPPPDATGLYPAAGADPLGHPEGRLVVGRAPGHEAGMIYDIGEGAVMGRGDSVDIRLEDPFASSRHARFNHPRQTKPLVFVQTARFAVQVFGSRSVLF